MKKQLLLSLLMLFCIAATFAQTVSSDFFEVFLKPAHPRHSSGFSLNKDSLLSRIYGLSDTASTYATFVVSVNDAANVDSLSFVLVNSQQTTVYSETKSISALQSSSSFKINGNTLYYTVGPFPYLKHFSATAMVRGTDGQSTPIQSFAKN